MTPTSTASSTAAVAQHKLSTRALLVAGAVTGPVFAAVATGQVLLREGFDLRRHPLSQLATGGPGFIQIINFI